MPQRYALKIWLNMAKNVFSCTGTQKALQKAFAEGCEFKVVLVDTSGIGVKIWFTLIPKMFFMRTNASI